MTTEKYEKYIQKCINDKHIKAIVHPHLVWNTRLNVFWPSIDNKDPYTIKEQKRSKDIVKVVYVTSVVQL